MNCLLANSRFFAARISADSTSTTGIIPADPSRPRSTACCNRKSCNLEEQMEKGRNSVTVRAARIDRLAVTLQS
jgi:hypothetical protein